MMRLPDFVETNIEPILVEWESFARRIWPGEASDPAELRDHAADILRAAVQDMLSDQTELERSEKSRGQGHGGEQGRRLNSASEKHGAGRVESGFNLKKVIAEYRALRASVIRLWRESSPAPDLNDLDDLTRFNESIDQSLASAVDSFADRVDQSRRLFLAILGHDLRNPLNALTMSAQTLLLDQRADEETSQTAEQITASSAAMARMLDDLLDFAATGLGGMIPLKRAPVNLDGICREVIREMRAAHPGCAISSSPEGDLRGEWDATRMRQVVSNLLGNAVQHGSEECRVKLSIRGEETDVVLAVHNDGPPIPPSAMDSLFDPLRRRSFGEAQKRHRPGSIGLGLYIVHQVVTAHGGTIHVTSSAEAGTTFTVHLPRHHAPV